MRFPDHVILDVSKQLVKLPQQYWLTLQFPTFKNNKFFRTNLVFQQTFQLFKKPKTRAKILKNEGKFTIFYKSADRPLKDFKNKINSHVAFFKIQPKIKNRTKRSKYAESVFTFFNEKRLKLLIVNSKIATEPNYSKTNKLWTLFDINFIKKEKIYTKLKYSRVPQYDTVSGGVAALFAGFLGFLICEKFGFELLDSGDFYFFFMYTVFLSFFLRLFLKIMSIEKNFFGVFSLKWLLRFNHILTVLIIKKLKKLFKS